MKESVKAGVSQRIENLPGRETSTPPAAEGESGRQKKIVSVEKAAEQPKPALRERFGNALGFIETRGYIPVVEASDAMLKAANIKPIMYRKLGMGLVVVGIAGEISAVRTAVESGVAAAQRGGATEVKSCVIANPSPGLSVFLPGSE
jgi:hypothetical protein